MVEKLAVNDGKKEFIEVDGCKYSRLPIKTKVVMNDDDIIEVVKEFAADYLQDGDILFITEKIVACTQNRAIPMKDINPRWLAKFLSKFVKKTPYGIGLGIPETMEMALRECGVIKILFAAFISVIGKMLHKDGWFYIIAGEKARAIDGPCDCTLPPYNNYVVLAPLNADCVAESVAKSINKDVKVVITDINDLGGNILGASSSNLNREKLAEILKDNPLGQCSEQTPMGIIRKISE